MGVHSGCIICQLVATEVVSMNDEYLSPREAAELLRTDRETIYRMVKAGELQAVRLRSRLLRISRGSLETALKPSTQPQDDHSGR